MKQNINLPSIARSYYTTPHTLKKNFSTSSLLSSDQLLTYQMVAFANFRIISSVLMDIRIIQLQAEEQKRIFYTEGIHILGGT